MKFSFNLKIFSFLIVFPVVFLSGAVLLAGQVHGDVYQNTLFQYTSSEMNGVVTGCEYTGTSGLFDAVVSAMNIAISGSGLDLEEAHIATGCQQVSSATASAYFYNELNGNGGSSTGLITALNNVSISLLDERPASGQTYVNQQIYALSNLGKANAQSVTYDSLYYPGTGFSLLQPIQSFWGWSVNVVYGILIFVIIGVAFAIMFRSRLGGATAVTIQSAIPNIALAMILVPLSYAITGFFIDIVTIGTNVAHEFLIGNGSPARVVYESRNCSQKELRAIASGELSGFGACEENKAYVLVDGEEEEFDRGLFADDRRLTWYSSGGQTQILTQLYDTVDTAQDQPGLIGNFLSLGLFKTIAGVIDSVAGAFGDNSAGDNGYSNVPAFWFAKIIQFLISILLLITGFRIFVLLLQKYLVFILFPIFSPFVFATVAIPGNATKQIIQYLKTMGSASAFYIITYAMFLLSIVLANVSFVESIPLTSGNLYVPPMLGLELFMDYRNIDAQEELNTVFVGINGLMFAVLSIIIYLNIPPTLKSIDEQWGTKLGMPSFVNNAFSSARDSINLARRGVSTLGSARTTGINALNRTQGLFGIQPGDYRSVQGFVNRQLNRAHAWTSNVAERTGPIGRATIGTAGNLAFGGARRALGGEFSGRGDFGDRKLKGTLKWGGKPAPVVIDSTFVRQLQNARPGPNHGGWLTIYGGAIELEAEGFTLPPVYNRWTMIVRVAQQLGRRTASAGFRRRAHTDNRLTGPGGGEEIWQNLPFRTNPLSVGGSGRRVLPGDNTVDVDAGEAVSGLIPVNDSSTTPVHQRSPLFNLQGWMGTMGGEDWKGADPRFKVKIVMAGDPLGMSESDLKKGEIELHMLFNNAEAINSFLEVIETGALIKGSRKISIAINQVKTPPIGIVFQSEYLNQFGSNRNPVNIAP